MKLRQILEMPERIAQQEIQMPWKSIDTSKVLWTLPLIGNPDYTLKLHPLKTSNQQAVLLYGKAGVVGGMLVHAEGKVVEVSGLLVAKQYRGQGLAYSMYATMVQNGITVVSDDVQTPGDAGLWKRLGQQYAGHIGVTDGEVDEAIAIEDWTKSDPLTDHFTRLVLSPKAFARKAKAA